MISLGKQLLLGGAVALLAAAPGHSYASEVDCFDLLPALESRSPERRDISPLDLLRLRDIGESYSTVASTSLALSPDGSTLAFFLRRADPAADAYCNGLIVLDIQTGRSRLLDTADKLPASNFSQYSVILPGDHTAKVEARWSPSGEWIAYLKVVEGVTQVWGVRPSGAAAQSLTASPHDIERFAWSPNGQSLIYMTRSVLTDARHMSEDAGGGFLYDKRFYPPVASNPFPTEPVDAEFTSQALSGEIREASPYEVALIAPEGASDQPARVSRNHPSSGPHPIALIALKDREAIWSASTIRVTWPDGSEASCRKEACSHVSDLWWDSRFEYLYFLKAEGRARSAFGLYRWRPGASSPERILSTEGILSGCLSLERETICAHETSMSPRHLIKIDAATGSKTTLFEPNPEFKNLRIGQVKRLHWTNSYGLETFGDLVLPPNYQSGDQLPMVVTTYTSRGFLRGGTGDEYPIFALAAEGFAVLSFQRPPDYGLGRPGVRSSLDLQRENLRDWADRRSVQSSLARGVELIARQGVIDPARVGITGLSDGASTAIWALINSDLFAAASISSCCIEPTNLMTLRGPATAKRFREAGYPAFTDPAEAFWKPYSVERNARSLSTPLLMQVADSEFITALHSFSALKEVGQPVELFVYPDEGHVKESPRHRLAIYNRNISWFKFWLTGTTTPTQPEAEFQRWEALRASIPEETSAQSRGG